MNNDAPDIIPEEPYILHETWLTKPITELKPDGEPSNSFKINDHSWKLIVYSKGYPYKEGGEHAYLAVMLLACKISNTRNVKFTIKTLGGKKIAEESTEFAFSKRVSNRGFPNFIPLSEISQYVTPSNQLNFDLTIEFSPKTLVMGSSFRKTTGFVGLKPCGKTYFLNSFVQIMFHLNSFSLEILRQKNQQNSPEFGAIQNLFTLLHLCPIAPSSSEIKEVLGFKDEDDWSQKYFQSLLFKFFNNSQKLIRDTFLIKASEYTRQQLMIPNLARNNRKLFFSLQIDNSKQNYGSLKNFLDSCTDRSKESGPTSDEEITTVKFSSLPPVLIILLNPFQNTQGHPKIKERFQYPFELDMTPYMEDQRISTKYELFGVIGHQGEKFDGHFYAICRTSENRNWLKFDDTFVMNTNERFVLDDHYGSRQQNTSALLLSYIRKDKISEIMKKTEYSDLPDSALTFYKKWNEDHSETFPSVDIQLFTLIDYQNKIQPNATFDNTSQSTITLEKVPDSLLYKDILYEIKRTVGLNNASLWELDNSLLPIRHLPLTTPVKSVKRVFVSSQKEGKVPLFIGYFDPDLRDQPKILSIVSFEALDEKMSPAIAMQHLRSRLGISLEEKMACFIYNKERAKRINIAQAIGKENHGIIIFQKENGEILHPQPRSIDLLPELKKQRSFPQYLEFVNNSGKITAVSADNYQQEGEKIEFEISMRAHLRDLMRCIRILLNLPNNDSILLYIKENNRPSRKPLNLNEGGTILQFLRGNFVFYRIIRGISQDQLSETSLFQCSVVGERLNLIEKATFLMPQRFSVIDIINKFLAKNNFDLSRKDQLRIVQLNGPKIICTLDKKSIIPFKDNLNYRLEFIPQNQVNFPPENLLRVTFSKDNHIPSTSCFGFPFYLLVKREEKLLDTLTRINNSTDLNLNLNFNDFQFLYTNDISSINFSKLNENSILSNICTGKSTMLYIIPNNQAAVADHLSQLINVDQEMIIYY